MMTDETFCLFQLVSTKVLEVKQLEPKSNYFHFNLLRYKRLFKIQHFLLLFCQNLQGRIEL